jgi:hypothetical protein
MGVRSWIDSWGRAVLNQWTQSRVAAGLEALEPADRLSTADIRAMVEELGAMKAVLDQADRDDLADLYGALGLEVSYNYKTRGG